MENEKIEHSVFRSVKSASPDQKSDNRIRNTKYTMLTFLPYVIVQQFRSFSSVYFFVIMLAQLYPKLAVSSFASSFFPWLFVLTLALFNEGLDDYKRHQRDNESNSSLCRIWRGCGYRLVPSADIKVGDVILLGKGDRVPADCILLKVDDASGELFIRTDQLDGETDWKRRVAPFESQSSCLKALDGLTAEIEPPHKGIYSFTGTLDLAYDGPCEENGLLFVQTGLRSLAPPSLRAMPETRKTIPLDLENTVWANTVVATSAAVGLVIYTGNDTRSMMNTYLPRSKMGLIEDEVDRFVAMLGVISLITACFFTVLRITALNFDALIIFMRFLILFSYVIPISLKVTINLARIWYVRLIQKADRLNGVIVRSSSLQEELGRVSFFLTDKTGTLTKNEMDMKKVHLGTVCYGMDSNSIVEKSVRRILRMAQQPVQPGGRRHRGIEGRVFDLVEAIALCHSVTPVESDGEVVYQASSPDEVAMVRYAEKVGVRLHKRDRVRIVLQTQCGMVAYRILQTFPFNSDSKRMGIIVQREGTDGMETASVVSLHESTVRNELEMASEDTAFKEDEIIFLEKGADSAMKAIVNETDWADDATDGMARDGLRTLLFGRKVLSAEEYRRFEEEYARAKLSLVNRNETMLRVQESLEHGLNLVGITGVEDKLQDNVKKTLESLRNAGMKVWMLTGDKVETAVSIARSSRLLSKTDRCFFIADCTTREEVSQLLVELVAKKFTALVIDGTSLTVVIDHCLAEFIEAVKGLSCVVGCRYSPTQKATMAAALRSIAKETVCCIGDGGNDVSMITEADVGIGIEGKEGNQASLAADFSLKNFEDVAELFFWHGRRCYKNTASIAGIIIHRGTIISVIQGIFCALIYYVPISIFQGKMLMLFICFTFFPLLSFIYSEDVSRRTVMEFPELYKELRHAELLSFKNLLGVNLNSIFQGSVIMLSLFIKFREYYRLSVLVFTCLIFNEQAMVCLSVEHLNKEVVAMCTFSLFLYAISFYIFREFNTAEFLKGYLLYIVLVNLLAISLKVAVRIYKKWYKPASYVKLTKIARNRV